MPQKTQYLVVHCTATPAGRAVTAEDIRHWHTLPTNKGGRGWRQVGYTDLVHLDGRVERLVSNNEDEWVDAWEITNGVAGINSVARHIVYVGGTDAHGQACDTRTPAQRESLRLYVLDFVRRFPDVKVAGHNRFAAKACPSFDVAAWLREEGVAEGNIY